MCIPSTIFSLHNSTHVFMFTKRISRNIDHKVFYIVMCDRFVVYQTIRKVAASKMFCYSWWRSTVIGTQLSYYNNLSAYQTLFSYNMKVKRADEQRIKRKNKLCSI